MPQLNLTLGQEVQFDSLGELRKSGFAKSVSKKVIYSNLAKLIIPAAIEYILLQFVGMFDQIQVGVLGEEALSAVGISSQIRLVLSTAFQAINVGVTAMVARSVGENKKENFFKILNRGLSLCLIISIPIVILSVVFLNQILGLYNCPSEQTWVYAYDYLKVGIIFALPAFLTMAITAALRGFGDTRTPLMYNVLANVINVFLNWVLINGKLGFPRLEVKGAAIATVISQAVSFVIAVFVCMRLHSRISGKGEKAKKKRERISLSDSEKNLTIGILGIGLPAMFEQLIMRIGMSFFTRIAASLGTTLYAAHTVCLNIQQLTFMSGMAFSVGATTLAGQSLGAKRKDLAVVYSWNCAKLCLCASFVLSAVYAFLGKQIIGIYTNDPVIINAGLTPLKMVAVTQPLIAFQYVFSGAFRGVGDTKVVAVIGIISSFICRPLFAYIGVYVLNLGLVGAWIGLVADQTICSVLLIVRFCSCKWLNTEKVFERKIN